jgi:hypothetical protein
MESEESFLETLARYSFPIPLLKSGSGARSGSLGKKETIDKLTEQVKKQKQDISQLEYELRLSKDR